MPPDHAVIRATYSDYRRVKGRKVLQVICEVPIEQAPQVHRVLGEPDPGAEMWVAITKLNKEVVQQNGKERRKWEELKPSQQAGMLCTKAAFWRFLEIQQSCEADVIDAEDAAEVVRNLCNTKSRSEFDHDACARLRWETLEHDYQTWLRIDPDLTS